MSSEIDILISGLDFPEGPVFDRQGNLWCVELKGGSLVKLNTDEKVQRFATGGFPNGATVDAAGNIWFCDSGKNEIRTFCPKTSSFHTFASEVGGEALFKPNDLAFDVSGNLVFTCPGDSRQVPTGYICALTKEGKVEKIISNKYFPNGVAFTDEGKTLVIAETYKHRIWKGEWDEENIRWHNEYPWAETGGPIGPDGMAFDEDGLLYVAVYASGKIKVISPEGKIVQEYDLSGKNPTNCAFDPSGRWGLVVTEAEKGQLLSIKINKKGQALFEK